MDIEILNQPDSSIARVILAENEEIVAEAGCMVAMDNFIQANTSLRKGKGGGILGGLKRMVAGESLFLSTFRSPQADGEIFLAPKLPGDLTICDAGSTGLVVQATSYLACAAGVVVDVGFQGFKSIFSGESVFWLEISGIGPVLLSSFGAIFEVDVDGEYVVDTGHIVAFERNLTFDIGKPLGSSWLSTFLGKEGLVCKFKGRGKLWCQTHNPPAFGRHIGALLPPR
ncbi:MAG: TIGR00266 family protein [Cyanobacteria bacterium P01_D01_bin.123]